MEIIAERKPEEEEGEKMERLFRLLTEKKVEEIRSEIAELKKSIKEREKENE